MRLKSEKNKQKRNEEGNEREMKGRQEHDKEEEINSEA